MRTVLTFVCASALLAGCGQPTSKAEPAAPAAAVSAPVQAFAAGSMPIHPVQVNATLTALSGVDTAQASMRGRVTQADAQEFCARDPNGDSASSSVEECVSATLAAETAQGATGEHTASADCVAGTLKSSDWGDFRLAAIQGGDPSGRRSQVFFNSDGVEVGGNADGGTSAADLFTVLCPTRAAAWKASQ